jgi:hypothetical protein
VLSGKAGNGERVTVINSAERLLRSGRAHRRPKRADHRVNPPPRGVLGQTFEVDCLSEELRVLRQATANQGDHGINTPVGERKIENMMAHEPRRTHKKKLHLTDLRATPQP